MTSPASTSFLAAAASVILLSFGLDDFGAVGAA
jgi:hypothetical protein